MLTLAEQKALNALDSGDSPYSDAVHAMVGTYRNDDPAFAKRLEDAINERLASDPDLSELLVACFMRGSVDRFMQVLAQSVTFELAVDDVAEASDKAAADLHEHRATMGVL